MSGEYFRPRRMRKNGRSYMTAVFREAYSNDVIVAWTGRRNDPKRSWTQRSLETTREFYERVERELH